MPLIESMQFDAEYIAKQVDSFKESKRYKEIKEHIRYYKGDHDVLYLVKDLPDNYPDIREVDNQYRKAVDQKVNYSIGNAFTMYHDDNSYLDTLIDYFGDWVYRFFRRITRDAIGADTAYIYPYINAKGNLMLKRFSPDQILVFYDDEDKEFFNSFVRFYKEYYLDNGIERDREILEWYKLDGIYKYIKINGKLEFQGVSRYAENAKGEYFHWNEIPLIVFRNDDTEKTLLSRCKTIQDSINNIQSMLTNRAEINVFNTVWAIENYMGASYDQHGNKVNPRTKAQQEGYINLVTSDGNKGGVNLIQDEFTPDKLETALLVKKRALIENTRSFDSKDERFKQAPNEMNIQSMYKDIDLDADSLESEFQTSFNKLMYFVNVYFNEFHGMRYNLDETIQIEFNRNQMEFTGSMVDEIVKLASIPDIISRQTLTESLGKFVADPQEERKRIQKEKQQRDKEYEKRISGGNPYSSSDNSKDDE